MSKTTILTICVVCAIATLIMTPARRIIKRHIRKNSLATTLEFIIALIIFFLLYTIADWFGYSL